MDKYKYYLVKGRLNQIYYIKSKMEEFDYMYTGNAEYACRLIVNDDRFLEKICLSKEILDKDFTVIGTNRILNRLLYG